MKNKPINHKLLGGDVVDMTRDFTVKVPQRKTNSTMTSEELMKKAFKGSTITKK